MFSIGVNGGTWSITTEMFLYFLFPFLLIISRKSPKILVFAIVLAMIASLNVRLMNTDGIYANPIFRIPDFLCGIGFYFLRQKFKGIKSVVHILAVLALVLACVCLGTGAYQYMHGQFIVVPLFGLWIAMVFHSKSKFYNNKILEYLGMSLLQNYCFKEEQCL